VPPYWTHGVESLGTSASGSVLSPSDEEIRFAGVKWKPLPFKAASSKTIKERVVLAVLYFKWIVRRLGFGAPSLVQELVETRYYLLLPRLAGHLRLDLGWGCLKEPEVKKLLQLGYKVGDEDARYEGVEIQRTSPFQLMRSLAKEFGYKPLKAVSTPAPGGRNCLMWTLISGEEATEAIGIVADIKREDEGEYVIPTSTVFGLTKEEIGQLAAQGLKVEDNDRGQEGVEIQGASPFKVMRILCSKFGWTTDGEVVSSEAPGGRTAAMWTLTRAVK